MHPHASLAKAADSVCVEIQHGGTSLSLHHRHLSEAWASNEGVLLLLDRGMSAASPPSFRCADVPFGRPTLCQRIDFGGWIPLKRGRRRVKEVRWAESSCHVLYSLLYTGAVP
jgi:hypothetical protein